MTIICASKSERVMGADTLIVDTDAWVKAGHTPKIVKCKDGALAGAAGDSAACIEFLDWARRGRKGKIRRRVFKNCQGLVLTKRGDLLVYEAPSPDIITDDFYALGCAGTIARGRRTSGATILECVKACIQVSIACGGEPTILELDK